VQGANKYYIFTGEKDELIFFHREYSEVGIVIIYIVRRIKRR